MKKTNFTNPRWITGWLFALTFLAANIFSVNDVIAQYNMTYEPVSSTAFDDISFTGTALNLPDDGEANIVLPFCFKFYGEWFSPPINLRVGTNGGFLFGTTTGDVWIFNESLPAATLDRAILPFWDDLDHEGQVTENEYYQVKGVTPNRRMIIQWNMLVHWPTTPETVTFQVILYEGSNEIKFIYDDVYFDNPAYDYGNSATVGVQSGLSATQYSFNTPSLEDGCGISFVPTNNDNCAFNSLVINDEVNISLDAYDCDTKITPDMVLEAPNCGCYEVIVTDMLGNTLPNSPYVDHNYIGESVLVYVMDPVSGNMTEACVANIFDYMDPYIDCPTDTVEIFCWQVDDYAPLAWDNCDTSSVDMFVIDKLITTNPCDGSMPFGVLRYIDRSFVAKDKSGNVSDTCDVTIQVNTATPQQLDMAIHFPIWRTVMGGNPISCDEEYESTLDGCCTPTGCPVPEYSGVPFLRLPNLNNGFDTIYLYPNSYFPCNLTVSYFDMPENSSDPGCVKSYIRMWTVSQWSCAINYVRTYAQFIEIADMNDPEVICPDDAVITTNSIGDFPPSSYGEVDCGAAYQFPVPEMFDACAENLQWDISVANDMAIPIEFMDNVDPENPPYRVLPLGVNTVTYTVYDPCGNSDNCTFTVEVIDNTEPVAICQQFTVVGLTYDGRAEVPAYSFDSGSYDDCRIKEIKVRRMDWQSLPCDLDPATADEFKDYVTFCCQDIGNPVMIQLKVYDIFDNENECMVQVEVQDKLGPAISCPPTREVGCETVFDAETITLEMSNNLFGAVTTHDNCDDLTITERYDDSNYDAQCGVGYVYRTITATDPGGRSASCTQRIDFVNPDPFWINQYNPYDQTDDVIWPGTYQGYGCLNPADLHPDVTGWPELLEGACDLAGTTWKDDVFFFNDDDADALEACFKIIRHWKVIDWCQHRPDNYGQYLTWTYDQVIMVTDLDGPTITGDCEDKTTCTYDPNCESGYIELLMSATDVCTDGEEIKWHYGIDWDNDNNYGSFDWDSKVITGANVQALGPDNNGEFPIGTHKIYWTVWDQCGNSSHCEYLFTIQNCKAPTPYCLDNIATTLMGIDTDGDGQTDWGMIDIKAIDCAPCCLDAYHPCTYDIAISFSDDPDDNVRTFDCDDFGENTVEIWATAFLPDGSVTQDYCVTTIDIQDNFDVCNNGPGQLVNISGMIQAVNGNPLPGATVELDGSELGPQVTAEDGMYSFSAGSHGSYTVLPQRDGDDADGVTTLDLVLIQKHLLALKQMDSPYTIIAADVDANGKVSAADLFQLRQLILGIDPSFENTDSWRFIEGSYQFLNPDNPFNENYPTDYALNDVTHDTRVDFIGVKMGDINHTVALNGGQDVMNRNKSLTMVTDEQVFGKGEIIEVPVYAENFNQINGFQLTWEFDAQSLEFEGIEGGAINVKTDNIGLTQLNRGLISMSWSEAIATDVIEDEALFTLTFNTLKSSTISNAIQVSSSITSKEAYNEDLSVIDLTFNTRNAVSDEFELFQNTPNPFSSETSISFNLPEAGFATLTIQDVTGRIVKVVNGDFPKGLSTIKLDKSELNSTGILYYQLDSKAYTATKRMVVIQ
jgi:hypothetical protein